jgi:hypothetical protein
VVLNGYLRERDGRGFSAIIVILDGYYLRCEWAEKVAVGAPSEVLAQTAASENVEAKW